MKNIYIICIIVGFIANFTIVDSWGQIPPIPPPPPSNSDLGRDKELKIAKGDKTPPKIEVITKELRQGKNVVEVRIIDDSDLKTKLIVYVKNRGLSSTSLVEDSENHYVGLIESLPPSTVIRIDATDAANNKATIYKQLVVKEQNDFFSSILKIFFPDS